MLALIRKSAIIMTHLHPDVVKIDRSVIQNPDTETAARVIAAVRREADATGATILAEGVETPADLATARRIGATLAQGYRFGRPTGLPDLSHHGKAADCVREDAVGRAHGGRPRCRPSRIATAAVRLTVPAIARTFQKPGRPATTCTSVPGLSDTSVPPPHRRLSMSGTGFVTPIPVPNHASSGPDDRRSG